MPGLGAVPLKTLRVWSVGAAPPFTVTSSVRAAFLETPLSGHLTGSFCQAVPCEHGRCVLRVMRAATRSMRPWRPAFKAVKSRACRPSRGVTFPLRALSRVPSQRRRFEACRVGQDRERCPRRLAAARQWHPGSGHCRRYARAGCYHTLQHLRRTRSLGLVLWVKPVRKNHPSPFHCGYVSETYSRTV